MTPKGRRLEFDGEMIYIAGPDGLRIELFKSIASTPHEKDLAGIVGRIMVEGVGGNPYAIPIRMRS
jgi:hypothetical protein